MTSLKFIKILVIGCILFLSGCSPVKTTVNNNTYLCTLNARGTTPSNKTYYFSNSSKQIDNELEYKEYLNKLRVILSEIGYIETNHASAELCISLDYQIGNSYRYGNSSVSVSDMYSAYSKTTEDYRMPLLVEIKAYNNNTKTPIWEVIVNDILDRESQLQSVMPFIFLCSQNYFGKTSNGEQAVTLTLTRELEEKYGLIWPYSLKF